VHLAKNVHCEHVLDEGVVGLLGTLHGGDSGVVDENIDMAKDSPCFVDLGRDGLAAG